MAQDAQKAHVAMRLSLPPDVHEWLWAEKGRTGRPMAELAVEAIKETILTNGGMVVSETGRVELSSVPLKEDHTAHLRTTGKPLSDHVSPVPPKKAKKRGGRIR